MTLTAHEPGESTIAGAAVLDVVTGERLIDHVVVVRSGHVVDVVHRDTLPAAPTLFVPGATILPGLIDCHTHLTGVPDPQGPLALGSSAARDVLLGVRNAALTLRAGVTTVRDCGPMRALTDIALRDAVAEGVVPGPEILAAGAYMSIAAGAADIMWVTPDVRERLPLELRFGLADTPAEVRVRVRAILHEGADFIKMNVTGAYVAPGTRPDLPEFDEDEIRAAVDLATAYGTHVAAHAHGAEGIRNAVRAGVRSIEHGWMMDDEAARMMAGEGTYLVPTQWIGDDLVGEDAPASGSTPDTELARVAQMRSRRADAFRLAMHHGVRIAFGSDSGAHEHGRNPNELVAMGRLGMAPIDVLRAATVDAAELIGRADRVGTLVTGRAADLIAVRGDPTTDLRTLLDPVLVMKGGRVINTDAVDDRGSPTH